MVDHVTVIQTSHWSIRHHVTTNLALCWWRETALVVVVGRCVCGCEWGNDEFLTMVLVQDLGVAFSCQWLVLTWWLCTTTITLYGYSLDTTHRCCHVTPILHYQTPNTGIFIHLAGHIYAGVCRNENIFYIYILLCFSIISSCQCHWNCSQWGPGSCKTPQAICNSCN